MTTDAGSQGYVDCGDCPRISTGCLGVCDKRASREAAQSNVRPLDEYISGLTDEQKAAIDRARFSTKLPAAPAQEADEPAKAAEDLSIIARCCELFDCRPSDLRAAIAAGKEG